MYSLGLLLMHLCWLKGAVSVIFSRSKSIGMTKFLISPQSFHNSEKNQEI